MMTVAVLFCFTACGSSVETPASQSAQEDSAAADESEAAAVNGAAYGYAGDDPLEYAVYQYLAEEVSKNYDQADVCIPVVNIFHVDYTNDDDVLAFGDYWIWNYNIDGDTLKCSSGGSYPGVFHFKKEGDTFTVTEFVVVADGDDFDASAKELFGDSYEDFAKTHSDDASREELRRITVSDYVNLNGLDLKYYQDEGWDPVELYLQK